MNEQSARILLIESSGRTGLVGTALGSELRATAQLDPSRRHAQDLAPAVKRLLDQMAWRPRDVDAVFVSRGPGSYTGLRVGLMTAKALAYATRCGFIGVDTFAAFAERSPRSAIVADVIGDAQRDLLYAQRFTRGQDNDWAPASNLTVMSRADWLARLTPGIFVTGPGVDLVEAFLPRGTPLAPSDHRAADLGGLLQVGLERFRRGERDDPMTSEPLYVRPSSAEENWDRNSTKAMRLQQSTP